MEIESLKYNLSRLIQNHNVISERRRNAPNLDIKIKLLQMEIQNKKKIDSINDKIQKLESQKYRSYRIPYEISEKDLLELHNEYAFRRRSPKVRKSSRKSRRSPKVRKSSRKSRRSPKVRKSSRKSRRSRKVRKSSRKSRRSRKVRKSSRKSRRSRKVRK